MAGPRIPANVERAAVAVSLDRGALAALGGSCVSIATAKSGPVGAPSRTAAYPKPERG